MTIYRERFKGVMAGQKLTLTLVANAGHMQRENIKGAIALSSIVRWNFI